MTNIATLLKSEILRLARKEIRAQVTPLKKSVAAHRSEIAALKRDLKEARQEVRRMAKGSSKAAPTSTDDEAAPSRFRYSPEGLAAQRKRLELSAEDCGLLVGSTGQSIYKWEAGKAKPRQQYLPRIAALRTFGKKSAAERVAELRSAS